MKKSLLILFTIITALMTASPVVLAAIDNAIYSGTIRATNTGALAEHISANVSINTSSWIDSGISNSTATNFVILNSSGANTTFMPGYGANPWIVWFDEAPANGNIDATLYTNASDGKIRYFPGDGGLSVPYDADLEIGAADNWSIELPGFFDTSASNLGANITTRGTDLRLFVGGSENITLDGSPNWHFPYSASSNWTGANNVRDGNTATYASQNIGPFSWSSFVTFQTSATLTDRVKYWISIVGGIGPQINLDAYYDGAWHDIYQGGTANNTWETRSLGDNYTVTAARAAVYNNDAVAHEGRIYEFGGFYDQNPLSISVTGVSIDEHTLKVEGNGTLLGLGVDASDNATLPISANLTFNAPLWHDELSGSSFNTKDFYWVACNVTGATWSATTGRTFDGTNDEITASYGSVSGLNAFTISLWAKWTQSSSQRIIYSERNSGVADLINVWINYNAVGDLYIWYSDGTLPTVIYGTGAEGWNDGNWHYVVMVRSATNQFDLYIDNTWWSQATDNVSAGTSTVTAIGRRAQQASWFAGSVGEVQVYNRALSIAERTHNYYAAKWKYDGSSDAYYYQVGDIPEGDEDWVFASDNSMPYVEYIQMTINGTPKGRWQWEYGSTFTDRTGNGHTATPDFRTTSSSANISASLINFSPITLAQIGDAEAQEWPSITESPPEEPSTAFTENATPGIFFQPFVDTIWGLSGLPNSIFWYNFAFTIIIGLGILVFFLCAKNNAQALLLKCIIMTATMIFFALPGPNIYGLYIVIYFIFWCFGILVLSRSFGW